MDDLISRLSELRSQYNCFDESERDAYHTLSETIEALQEQKTGKWYEDEEVGLCRCDQCQAVNLIHTPFCPMCGARMECEEDG